MKRSIISLLTIGAISASANAVQLSDNTKLEVFGEVSAQHIISHDTANGDDSNARLGVRGTHVINDQLTAFGLVDGEYKIGSDHNGEQRVIAKYGYAGLDYNGVRVSYGRQDGVVKLTRNLTDLLPGFGGDAVINGDEYWFNGINDNLLSVQYKTNGLSLTGQYIAKDEYTQSTQAKFQHHGEGYGAGVTYNTGPVTLSAAYTTGAVSELQKRQYDVGHADTYIFGAALDTSFAYFAATMQKSRNQTYLAEYIAGKSSSYEVVANLKTSFGLTPSLAWNYAKASDFDTYAWFGKDVARNDKVEVVNYIALGAKYELTDNVSVKAAYKWNLLNDESKQLQELGVNTDDQVKLALTYVF